MATGRFRNIIPVRSNFVPENYVPDFGALATALGAQQQAFDKALAVSEKVPNHLQQDTTDVQDYMSTVRNQINNIAETYANEGVSAGNRARKQLLREINRDWQPGGKADRFQKRLATVQSLKETIDDQYKDDPRIAQYYKQNIKINPFSDETSPNYGIGTPSFDKILSTEDISTHYDKTLGNIKADQVVSDAYLDRNALRGVSFKDLLTRGKTKYIDWNKAAQVLIGATTPEIQRSEEVRGKAYGLGEGQGQFLMADEEGNLAFDEQGRIQFNANTALGRMLSGYTTGTAFTEQDVSDKVVENTYARQLALWRKKQEEKDGNAVMLSQPFNIGQTIFGNEVKTTSDGKLKLAGFKADRGKAERQMVNKITDKLQNTGSIYTILPGFGVDIAGKTVSFMRQLFGKNETFDVNNPPEQLANAVNVLKANGTISEDMNAEQQNRVFQNVINYYLTKPTMSAQLTPVMDKKVQDNWNQIFFRDSKNKTSGIVSNLSFKDQQGNVKKGVDVLDMIDEDTPINFESQVTAPQSLLPYGTRVFQIGKEEFRMEPIESDKQTPEYIINMQYRAMNGLLDNFSVEEELPPMPNDPKFGGMEKLITRRGKYKMEYTPEGFNMYFKGNKGYNKLNEEPIQFE